jgi:hypothetical protein
MNKFEKLIEYIINDEDQKARELFHDIVVEKSRDIYESIMDEESMEENVAGNQVEDMVDEISTEEAVGEDEEAGEEFELGGDDSEADEQGDEFGAEEGHSEEQEIEDKVMNIDAKLDELLAKFDEIMGDDSAEEMPAEEPGMEMPAEEPAMFEAEDCDTEEEDDEEKDSKKSEKKSGKPFEGKKSATELMREYVETVGDIYGGAGDATEGDAVGSSGKKTAVNTKDVNGPGANFGGTTATSKGGVQNQDGTSAPSTEKAQEIKSGNVNVPGGKAALGKGPVAKTGEESAVSDKSVVAKK